MLRWLVTAVVVTASLFVVSAQTITSEPQRIEVLAGNSVELTCTFRDLGDQTIAWSKKSDVLFLDEDVLADEDDRRSVLKENSNYVLTINRVQPSDDDNYTCFIPEAEGQTVVYRLVVQTKPTVVISPDERLYSVKVGESQVVITCNHREGNPKPEVKWSRNDGEFPPGMRTNGKQLTIAKVTKAHAGTYTCTGTNSAGKDTATIQIQVTDPTNGDEAEKKPWIKTELSVIPVKKGTTVNITCTYDGSPAPQIDWSFNGFKIALREKFLNATTWAKRIDNATLTILSLKDINEDTFGDYSCKASNELGSAKATIHVSGMPGPPSLTLEGSELTWSVRAIEKVLEYRLFYRHEGQGDFDKYESVRPAKTDNNGDDLWEHTFNVLPLLVPGVKYDLQVRARNALGWGSLAREHVSLTIPSVPKETAGGSVTSLTSAICILLLTIFV